MPEATIQRPKRLATKTPAQPKAEQIDTIPAFMAHAARHLESIPYEELVSAAQVNKVKWEGRAKPDIIADILVAEEEKMRRERAQSERAAAQAPVVEAVAAPDPMLRQLEDGSFVLDLTPAELSIIFAAMLSMEAVVHPSMGMASHWTRHANREGQSNNIVFSRQDASGIDRRYRIKVSDLTALVVEPL